MDDKEIVDLALAETVSDEILIPCYVPGAPDPAQKVSGAQIKMSLTPSKGTDYWTEEDKAEIVAAVIADLPVYSGETGDVKDDLPIYNGETEDLT